MFEKWLTFSQRHHNFLFRSAEIEYAKIHHREILIDASQVPRIMIFDRPVVDLYETLIF